MLKKTILILSAALILKTGLWAAPRDSVVIVRPNVPSETQKTFLSIADYFNMIGEQDAVAFMKGWAQGGHGSGFAVKLSDGSIVIVTNRHVAGNALTAEIVIEDGDNNKNTIPDCPVIYVDDALDIALIAVPKGTAVSTLNLADAVPNDGADVWSAGYPGLIDRPSWQLAKGNITNRNVLVPEMGEPNNDGFVQHSALIDPGNSGGPLFIGDPAKIETVKVVGVNTWTIRDRSNTFFAIPVNKLKEALARYTLTLKNKADQATALQKSCQDFVKFMNGDEWGKFDYLRLFSTSSATAVIWDEMVEEFKTMNVKDRQIWIDRFFTSPANTLRQYNSWEMWQRVHFSSGRLELTAVQGTDLLGAVPVSFSLAGKTMDTVWINESGRWLFQSESGRKAPPSAVAKAGGTDGIRTGKGFGGITPTGIKFFGGLCLPPSDAQKSALGYSLGIEFETEAAPQLTRGIMVRGGDIFMVDGDRPQFTNSGKLGSFGIAMSWNYYFPYYNGNAYTSPFIGVGAGLNLNMFTNIKTENTMGSYDDGSGILDAMFMVYVFPRLGVEFSLKGATAFGVAASMEYGVLGIDGIRSIPIEAYYKFLLE